MVIFDDSGTKRIKMIKLDSTNSAGTDIAVVAQHGSIDINPLTSH